MWERIVDPVALAVVGCGAFVAFLIGLIGGKLINNRPTHSGDNKEMALRALEAALLALIGAMLARFVISVLCGLADDDPGACLLVGWGFALWPGVIDFVAWIVEAAGGNDDGWRMSTPDSLMWWGTAVGLFVGCQDGLWRVHDWRGAGWITFPIDFTWGLANTTNAALLHLVNFAWGDHAIDPRNGAHRYESGFRWMSTYAFTQGNCMSNMDTEGPTSALWKHENTHILQNRIFGPLFTLTYLGWMLLWIFPALIGAAVKRDGHLIQDWCYFNCPWEVWGYAVGQKHGGSPRTDYGNYIWSARWVGLPAFLFFSACGVGLILAILYLWVGVGS